MINLRIFLSACVAMMSLQAIGAEDVSAARTKAVKILGMNVESDDLTRKDKKDLFRVLQSTLKAYPSINLQNPPDAELTDIMMDLECIDMDVECLAKLGKKYGAQRVFYTQVDKTSAGYNLIIRVVSVSQKKALLDKTSKVKSSRALANVMQEHIVKVFGKPPSKEPKPGTIRIKSAVPGAKIFVNGLYIGIGRIKLKRPPGKYTVRVTRPGYTEVVFNVTVRSGKTVKKRVKMKYVKVAKDAKKDPKKLPVAGVPIYEKWWFWASIGGGVLLTTIIAVAASGDGDDGPVGPIVFSVDPQNAWRDVSVQGAAR